MKQQVITPEVRVMNFRAVSERILALIGAVKNHRFFRRPLPTLYRWQLVAARALARWCDCHAVLFSALLWLVGVVLVLRWFLFA